MVGHTSVLSPDAGRLASGVSKGPLVREIHRLPVPQGRPTSVPSPASYVIRGGTAGSPRECSGPSNRGPRVMPTLMPIGSQNQSVGVGPMGRRVFRRRSQTGPVRLRTLSGNPIPGNWYRGFESLSLRGCDVSRHRGHMSHDIVDILRRPGRTPRG